MMYCKNKNSLICPHKFNDNTLNLYIWFKDLGIVFESVPSFDDHVNNFVS